LPNKKNTPQNSTKLKQLTCKAAGITFRFILSYGGGMPFVLLKNSIKKIEKKKDKQLSLNYYKQEKNFLLLTLKNLQSLQSMNTSRSFVR
jgi:hypothetical protein